MTTDGERIAQEQLAARTTVVLRPFAGPLTIATEGTYVRQLADLANKPDVRTQL